MKLQEIKCDQCGKVIGKETARRLQLEYLAASRTVIADASFDFCDLFCLRAWVEKNIQTQ